MGKPQPTAAASAKGKADVKGKKEGKTPSKASADAENKTDDKNVPVKDADKSKKNHKSEIDDIFSAGKQKAKQKAEGKREAEEPAGQDAATAGAANKKPRVEGSKDDIFGEAAGKGRKRTEEGYAIYTEDELGLGKKGGDTDLCPFDCDCCF